MLFHFIKNLIGSLALKTRFNARIPIIFLFILSISLSLAAQAAPGDLDPTFGNGGKVITSIGGSIDIANAAAIQSDGKIIAAGYSYNTEGNADFALVRYNLDGSLDASFGNGGKVITPIGISTDIANAVAIPFSSCFFTLTAFLVVLVAIVLSV